MPSSRLHVLQLTQSYHDAQQEASELLRQALWKLTVAQHKKPSLVTASDLRETLTPRLVLKQENLPNLAEEQEGQEEEERSTKMNEARTIVDFQLVDPVNEQAKDNTTTTVEDIPSNSTTIESTGLRLRKKSQVTTSNDDDDDDNPWSQEPVTTSTTTLQWNPLDLFGGLPPRELKEAQDKATHALQCYVQVAQYATQLQASLTKET